MTGHDQAKMPVRTPRFTDLRHTTAFRLSAGLTAVFVAVIFAVLWLVYTQTAAELDQRTDLTIMARAHLLAATPAPRRMEITAQALQDSSRRLEGIAVFDAAGRKLIGDDGLAPPFPIGRIFERLHGPRDAPVRALALPTADRRIVVVSRDTTPSLDLRARILAIMVISGASAVAVALGAGIALSLVPMRRIRRLEATAARIAAGELDSRIAVSGRGDEFDMIAGIINAMVEEIERLLRQVKGATDAIAHDLRTPLSHVRTRLERIALLPAIAADPDGDATQLLSGARAELDAVLARFRALLRMSELEAMHRLAQFAVFDPVDMLRDVAELYEPLAEERGIALITGGKAGQVILGDDRLLFEAISNLVENAIKFCSAGCRVDLDVTDFAGQVAIVVADDGPGIAPTERAQVLQRFQRGSVSSDLAGSGLGLSLVAVIVALHGYKFYLDPAFDGPRPGLMARIVAPHAATSASGAGGTR